MQFVRSGGFWRNFLVKYPESNQMHKRMLRVSKRLKKLEKKHGKTASFLKAQDFLWQSQCNCPYWHGVFGGLYLNHLRFAIFRCLIQADVLLDQLEHPDKFLIAEESDFDCDGKNEVTVENNGGFYCFRPSEGGALVEIDLKKFAINVADGLTRRKEAYHRKVEKASQAGGIALHDPMGVKEDNLHKHLFYDWYRKGSFIDHFFSPATTLPQFQACQYAEWGDFIKEPFEVKIKAIGSVKEIIFTRTGNVWKEKEPLCVRLQKHLRFHPDTDTIQAQYCIRNLSGVAFSAKFGVEFMLTLLAGNADDRFFSSPEHRVDPQNLASVGEIENISKIDMNDGWLNLKLSLSSSLKATWWRFPQETISQSEGGYERTYQASVLFPHWDIALKPDEEWKNSLTLEALTFKG
jgi:alpha-amylase